MTTLFADGNFYILCMSYIHNVNILCYGSIRKYMFINKFTDRENQDLTLLIFTEHLGKETCKFSVSPAVCVSNPFEQLCSGRADVSFVRLLWALPGSVFPMEGRPSSFIPLTPSAEPCSLKVVLVSRG